MANRPRALDPQASPAALFGAELRALRQRRSLSLAAVGRLVHVSGDLIGKIEKADRRPQADLVTQLDRALEAEGAIERLGRGVVNEDDHGGRPASAAPVLSPDDAPARLRQVIDTVRNGDHAMNDRADPGTLVSHALAAERVLPGVGRDARTPLYSSIAEAHQLAGWMSFDHGRPRQAERLLGTARGWVERATDPALAAFVLGPNLSFVATYGGDPALGVERAYGAIGWARRSGNHRLTGFAMAIGARAHARLGETDLCLDLLDQASTQLERHDPDGHDPDAHRWLSVFDRAALDGHRGSCLLDLDQPDRALAPLAEQERTSPHQFVRNRVIWRLDRIDALLRLGEIDQACADLAAATDTATGVTPRVLRRFAAIGLRLGELPRSAATTDALDRLRLLSAASA
ncbi:MULTISPECIES: helix-turn-helix domain-containing protein [Pseudonocardia]|uniref:Helix-turn-helix domain-containing protein n=1 Tax=Pseudonocardia abyssalis TaxID=2792008 RepID=A0ABS6V1N2_9PSEU|nr:helix-turn-helix transcriptional regulator [Pseudonocardia abyssalis]MBW0113962.1 helix-turn-helix domain-containing protein [Pseudonocardia abyssalis]MBW0138415.1 helix-turn-helix domain-containing protein [Pseudonocardia abyssalis]